MTGMTCYIYYTMTDSNASGGGLVCDKDVSRHIVTNIVIINILILTNVAE